MYEHRAKFITTISDSLKSLEKLVTFFLLFGEGGHVENVEYELIFLENVGTVGHLFVLNCKGRHWTEPKICFIITEGETVQSFEVQYNMLKYT